MNFEFLNTVAEESNNLSKIKEYRILDGESSMILYDDGTSSYYLYTINEKNNEDTLQINEDEFVFFENNGSIFVHSNNKIENVFVESEKSTYIDQNLVMLRASWLYQNTTQWNTTAWIQLIEMVSDIYGLMTFKITTDIFEYAVDYVTSNAWDVWTSHCVTFYVTQDNYIRSDCVLYQKKDMRYYSMGYNNGFVEGKSTNWWSGYPAIEACKAYPYI